MAYGHNTNSNEEGPERKQNPANLEQLHENYEINPNLIPHYDDDNLLEDEKNTDNLERININRVNRARKLFKDLSEGIRYADAMARLEKQLELIPVRHKEREVE